VQFQNFNPLTVTCWIYLVLQYITYAALQKYLALYLQFVLVPGARNILLLAYVLVIDVALVLHFADGGYMVNAM